jgi:hypothetical protein
MMRGEPGTDGTVGHLDGETAWTRDSHALESRYSKLLIQQIVAANRVGPRHIMREIQVAQKVSIILAY